MKIIKNSNSIYVFFLVALILSCQNQNSGQANSPKITKDFSTSLIVLGNLQDGGLPHISCKKKCCTPYYNNRQAHHKVVSLGLIDRINQKTFIIEATPDFTEQIEVLQKMANFEDAPIVPDGILITHAHIGHYTGLMFLGKEAMNAKKANVYCMPKMENFLSNHGPWSQLVNNQNILTHSLKANDTLRLSPSIKIIPFTVPHRDEYSETVGYEIIGPEKKILFIPDIDKWEKWKKDIVQLISNVDLAFLDGTFFDAEEINYRDISAIPHPFIIESLEKFKVLSKEDKAKIHFIHLNHTNPLNDTNSKQTKELNASGLKMAAYLDQWSI